jgi:uncharacterized membrane protein
MKHHLYHQAKRFCNIHRHVKKKKRWRKTGFYCRWDKNDWWSAFYRASSARFEIDRIYAKKNCVVFRMYPIQVTEYESKTLFDNDVIWNVVSLIGFLLSILTSKLVRTKQLNTFSLHLIGDSGMLRSLTVTHQIRAKGENVHRFRRQEQRNYWKH